MKQRLSRTILGFSLADILFWTVVTMIVVAFTIVWDIFLVPAVNDQSLMRYILTAILLALCVGFTVLSLVVSRLLGQTIRKPRATFLVRLGTAMMLIGTATAPIGLYHATDPERSVPVGFAYFTLVFIGMFLTGFAGNSLAPAQQ